MSKESAEKKNGFRIASDPILSEKSKAEGSEGQAPTGPIDKLRFEDLGALPTGYGEMFVIARDPHWIFTYWDFDYAKFPMTRRLYLEVYRNEELESTIEINEVARNWYIPVNSAATAYTVVFGYRDAADAWTRVGKAGPTRTPPESVSPNWETQFATIPFHLSFNFLLDVIAAARAEGQPLTEALARLQQEAGSGPGGASSWGTEQIKVLETLLGKNFLDRLFSMSSQEVLEFLHGELSGKLDSESASELLAKGRLASMLAPGESSLFSGSIGEFVRQELSSGAVSNFGGASSQLGGVSSEVGGISSEVLVGGSETLASWQAGVREIIAKWEQAVSSLGLSSEVLASWQAGLSEITTSFARALGSLGLSSEVLASWQAGLSEISGSFAQAISSYGLSSETLASWQAGIGESFAKWESALSSYGLGSEVSASWQAGLSEITSSWETALSSYSLSSETLASWQAGLGGIASSWETAFGSLGISSYSFGSEQLSSLSLSSWSGLEFGLSSWSELLSESSLFSGIGASWSAQPFGRPERSFFMHVNAEIIFYGGTDPEAKVTIAGRPVQLQPDGTFRYHFKFPDNEFEIPVVAVSPDGVETRSATLFFQRDTARYGEVGSTAQPEHLGVPMGERY